jgi:uncharacterized BrkB/YihY/UPF0761 family membrane protein
LGFAIFIPQIGLHSEERHGKSYLSHTCNYFNMTRINYLALIAMNLLGIIFIYKRLHNDSDPWLQSVLVPLGIAVLTFNLPVLIACGIDYLFNKKFNARMFNNIVYFFIVTLLLAFFFPGILKMR